MAVIHMRDVWKARDLILKGHSVKEISKLVGMSEATIRKYTKSEREKVKDKRG